MNAYVNESIARQRIAEIERRAARPRRIEVRESRRSRIRSLVLRVAGAAWREDTSSFGSRTGFHGTSRVTAR